MGIANFISKIQRNWLRNQAKKPCNSTDSKKHKRFSDCAPQFAAIARAALPKQSLTHSLDISSTSNPNMLFCCYKNDWCCSPSGNASSCCDSDNSNQLFLPIKSGEDLTIYNGSARAAGFRMVLLSALANRTATATTLCNGTVYGDTHKAMKIGVSVRVGVGVPLPRRE